MQIADLKFIICHSPVRLVIYQQTFSFIVIKVTPYYCETIRCIVSLCGAPYVCILKEFVFVFQVKVSLLGEILLQRSSSLTIRELISQMSLMVTAPTFLNWEVVAKEYGNFSLCLVTDPCISLDDLRVPDFSNFKTTH